MNSDVKIQFTENQTSYFTSVFHFLPVALAVLDQNGMLIAVNPKWRASAKSGDMDLLQTELNTDYLDSCQVGGQSNDWLESALEGVKNVLQGEIPEFSTEYQHVGKNGIQWFRFRARRIQSPKSVLLIHEEVTDQRRAQVMFQSQTDQLQRLVTSKTADLILTKHQLQREVKFRDSVSNELKRKNDLLNALTRLQSRFIRDSDATSAFSELLDMILKLTESEFGFIATVSFSHDKKPYIQSCAVAHRSKDPRVKDYFDLQKCKPLIFDSSESVFHQILLNEEPVILNGSDFYPKLPDDHPAIQSLMAVPVMSRGEMVGLIALANRAGGYAKEWLSRLDTLFLASGNMIKAWQDRCWRRNIEQEIRRNYDVQGILNAILRQSLENMTLEEIIQFALDQILSISWLSFHGKGFIFIRKFPEKALTLVAARGISDTLKRKCARVEPGTCLCGQAALEKRFMFATPSKSCQCYDPGPKNQIEYGFYCVPILSGEVLLGIINIHVKSDHEPKHYEKEFFTAVSNTMAGIIMRKRAEEKVNILAQFPDDNPNPVMRITKDGILLYANATSMKVLRDLRCRIGKPVPEKWVKNARKCLEMGTSVEFEIDIRQRVYQFICSPASSMDMVYLYGLDITISKQYQEQLTLMASVFENTIEGIFITDSRAKILTVNPAFTAITGYSPSETIGQNPRILKSNRHGKDFYRKMWQSILQTGKWQGEIWNRKKDGTAFPEWLSINSIKDYRGNTTHYVAVFHDISEIKRSEEKLKYYAYHDALTGLPNRQLFNDRLERTLTHAGRSHEQVAVLYLDLDNFKTINDSLGHSVGDILLQKVANRLVQCCRKPDTVSRVGGDEFILILPDVKAGEVDAVNVARRIIASFSRPFAIFDHEIYTSPSIGITIFPHDGEDAASLVKNADMAMYRAKEKGKNNYELYTPSMNTDIMRRMTLETNLRKALENKEFIVYYQPQIDVNTGKIIGTEALIRWQRSPDQEIYPDEFIPFSEDTGFIVQIGQYVLRTACHQTRAWHDMGFDHLTVSVNLSPKQFQDANLKHFVQTILDESGLGPEYLLLEITENTMVMNIDATVSNMKAIDAMGIRLSIDDFGTGYSSLVYLKRFPIREIKIDKTFIKEIPGNPDDLAICKAILSMAKNLNLMVVAEGVETGEQLEFLKRHECHAYQGFLFSPAIEKSALTRLLLKQNMQDHEMKKDQFQGT